MWVTLPMVTVAPAPMVMVGCALVARVASERVTFPLLMVSELGLIKLRPLEVIKLVPVIVDPELTVRFAVVSSRGEAVLERFKVLPVVMVLELTVTTVPVETVCKVGRTPLESETLPRVDVPVVMGPVEPSVSVEPLVMMPARLALLVEVLAAVFAEETVSTPPWMVLTGLRVRRPVLSVTLPTLMRPVSVEMPEPNVSVAPVVVEMALV